MRIKLTLLMMLCLVFPALADTGLTGTLVDAKTGKAVADANVLLRDQAIFVKQPKRGHIGKPAFRAPVLVPDTPQVTGPRHSGTGDLG